MLAIALAAAIIVAIVLLVSRGRRRRAVDAWRTQSAAALDASHLAMGLLPASSADISDETHWETVRQRVAEAADQLERAATAAPTEDAALASRREAEALRGLAFALEADRLLRSSTQAPSATQLIESDQALRSRRADAESALQALEQLIRPVPQQAPQSV